jgi:DNA-binding transcriptional ArsR family regulator
MALRDLFISKVRVKLLETFLSFPKEMFFVRDLSRKTGEEINAVRRELTHLEKVGLVKKEPRGNRIYYWLDKTYPFYPELVRMVAKSTGLGAEILKNRQKLGRITNVLFSTKFVKWAERGTEEVDVLVVGEVVLPELAALIRAEEEKRGQEINYTVMTPEEFIFRKRRRDPFLLGILGGPRVMIIGEEEELVKTV